MKKQKKSMLGIISVLLILVMILTACQSPEKLMAKGNYEEAYEKADDSEKNNVLAENVIAVLSAKSAEMLKDPSSFVLRDAYYRAWYDSEAKNTPWGQRAVLHITGTNSYGAAVSSYWAWQYHYKTDTWEFIESVNNTTIEDDDDSMTMGAKDMLKQSLEYETVIKLDKEQIKNINAQFENDTLDSVELIKKNNIDTSLLSYPEHKTK